MSDQPARMYAANPAKVEPGTIVDLFFSSIEQYDLARALLRRTGDGWQPISHRQLLADVQALSEGLSGLGLQRGDRVALLSENRVEWPLADYAMLCSGILNVPIYPTLPANQLSFILKDAGVRAVFVSTAEQLEKVRECSQSVPSVQHIIVFDKTELRGGRETPLDALVARGRESKLSPAEFRARAKAAKPDDVATIIYTSGTTGQPKGVMLTHNNIYSNVVAQSSWLKLDTTDDFVTVSFLPLSHIFQRMVDYALFYFGCTIAYSTIDGAVAALSEIRPAVAVAVPRVYEKIYAAILSATGPKRKLVLWARQVALDWAEEKLAGRTPSLPLRLKHAVADRLVFSKIRQRVGGRLHFFVSGGAPLPEQIAKFFYGAGILILEGYGLTETSPVIAVNTPEAMRIGTVGKPIASTEISIAADGEILTRGPQIMKGYYNNPEATREAIDPDGWFHTGDIGLIDADGFLKITDRKKDLIVTAGGKNIAPAPIQNAVKLSRYIADAVVIGDKRPYPILLVVPNFASLEKWAELHQIAFSDKEKLVSNPQVRRKIEDEVAERLAGFARFEQPKKVLLLPREFDLARGEVTPKLSVRRHVIEANWAPAIEALYAEPQTEKVEVS